MDQGPILFLRQVEIVGCWKQISSVEDLPPFVTQMWVWVQAISFRKCVCLCKCVRMCFCASVYVGIFSVYANIRRSLVIPLKMQSGVVKQRVFHFHLAGLTNDRGEMQSAMTCLSCVSVCVCLCVYPHRCQPGTLVHCEVSAHFLFIRRGLRVNGTLVRFVAAEAKGWWRRRQFQKQKEGNQLTSSPAYQLTSWPADQLTS